jgi:methylated-DNA-protein-cysteine methyltransferase related protein
MAVRGKSVAFARIRAEVIRLVGLIPSGRFTTYGSIAIHMNVIARHVATVLSRLTPEESATLPWHRVVSANARLSPNMDSALSRKQRRRLKAEGLRIDKDGYIQDADAHFHSVGVRRDIRWSEGCGRRTMMRRPDAHGGDAEVSLRMGQGSF